MPEARRTAIDDQLQEAILQLYPNATRIIDIRSFRQGYLAYPARLTVQTTSGDRATCVLKVSADADKLAYEARVLRALTDLQLPVPNVIADPISISDSSTTLNLMLISELPGQTIPWIDVTDLATADRTCRLVNTAVDRLHALTPAIAAHPIAPLLPVKTLEAEVEAIQARGGLWFDVPLFTEALKLVQTALPHYDNPLVFSNGDYNPLNFLVADDRLVGWLILSMPALKTRILASQSSSCGLMTPAGVQAFRLASWSGFYTNIRSRQRHFWCDWCCADSPIYRIPLQPIHPATRCKSSSMQRNGSGGS
ncbi:MAG TPA: phosphotransferase [Phototrophicaceae bacterium]|nr:phosphotransferase [Phototrophicaceae bacterium]